MTLEKMFKLKEYGTSVKTELTAGVTTFMAMAYIIAVNPAILSATGMDRGAVMTATIVSAVVATLIMAFYAKLPFAMASGMGFNAFFTYTIVLGMGKSWQFALTAVFVGGIIYLLLTLFKVRELLLEAVPPTLRKAIAAGIGLFVATIGLTNAGIIVQGPPLVSLGDITGGGAASLAFIGIIITSALLVLKIKAALLLGIIITTIIGIPLGVTDIAGLTSPVSLPHSLAPVFWQFDFSELFSFDMLLVIFVIIFLNIFDTMGALIGIALKVGLVDKKGNILNSRQAFLTDAFSSIFGAALGTSPQVIFVESAAGVTAGGRTGLTAATVAVLFALMLFFSPLFLIIPAAATTPALVMVGVFMLASLIDIDLTDYANAIPAFITIIMMPLTYSIASGVAIGLITYTLIRLLTGRFKEVKPITLIMAVFFVAMQFLI
ncbi:MAG: NCS2 family permease [Spirochaetaceae bacterium]|nr:NCS2 family permease [Spirochaetaceae bacterium]